jgi:choice-of-anchor B domain-containing protein
MLFFWALFLFSTLCKKISTYFRSKQTNMKNTLLLIIGLISFTLQAQQSLNTNFLGQRSYSEELSDIWGYEKDGAEYALVGVYNGISVVDVTNPSTPVELAFFNGHESTWRDLKTWGDYLYCINETNGGLQIVNLAEVISGDLNPTYIENTDLGFTTAHNVFIDENGVLYVFGSNYSNGGCEMYDLTTNPEQPIFLGVFDDYYFHDGMVRGDTLWGGAIYNGVFSVVDVSDKSNPEIIGSHSTPNTFSHNCWISDDGEYLFTTDEVSGAYVAAYDVSDLDDIQEVDRIQAWSGYTDVIPHNTHVDGDFIVTSYYRDGVSIVDISNPSNLIEVGYYDTSDDFSGNGFNGAWGTYPWLPSGNILVSDIENGLFIIEPKYTNASFLEGIITDAITGAPMSNVLVQIVGVNYSSYSALDGTYETGTADAGSYTVVFAAAGYEDQIIEVTLSSGENVSVSVELSPFDTYGIQVSVIDAFDFTGIPSASVNVYNEDFNFDWVSNQDGFVTSSLIPGVYNVSIGLWGYQTICSEFTVEENQVEITFDLEKGYSDDFSLDLGWLVENESSLTAGAWERGIPNGTDYQGQTLNPSIDADEDCGAQAYITGNTVNASFYEADVDGGRTSILSPIMDLSSFQSITLSFSTWFQNAGGQGTPNDSILIKLTNGSESILLDYRTVQTVSPNWENHLLSVSADEFDFTESMQLIVETMDHDNSGHLVEAGFDKFLISGTELSIADINKSAINIYPNPSNNGILNITIDNTESSFSISDITGKLIRQTKLHKGQNRLNLSDLSRGTYLIDLRSVSENQSILWIIE